MPDGADILLESLTRDNAQKMLDSLTERETQVMIGWAHTKKRKEIARDLEISDVRVGQLTAAARRKIGAEKRSDAVAAFVVARQLCNRPVYTEKKMFEANQVINKLVSDQATKEAIKQIASPEFRAYLRDLRSSGPKAWTARYGPVWRYVAGVVIALVTMVILIAAIELASALDLLLEGPS